MSAKTYDSRCFDLATVFLEDNPKIDINRAHQLACEIQQRIEDWLEYQESPCDGCGEPLGKGDHSNCVLF